MLSVTEAAAMMAADMGLPRPPVDDPDVDSKPWREWFRAKYLAAGKPVCKRCDGLIEQDDEAVIHPGWCLSCETVWAFDRIIEPLARRLGRRAALHALVELVRSAKSE
jgi:hypothetical protein